MDIETEISMEGNLSEFQYEHIKQKLEHQTNTSTKIEVCSQRKQQKKGKILKLKKRIKQSNKNYELSVMKLEYFSKLLQEELEKRQKEVSKISVLIKQYRNQITERDQDLKDIEQLCHKRQAIKQNNKSQASIKKKINCTNPHKKESPMPKKGHIKHKSSDMATDINKQKTLSHKSPIHKQKPSINTKSSQKIEKSSSNGKKPKPLRRFAF